MMILLALTVVGTFALAAMAIVQAQGAPGVDLRQKLKSLTSQPEGLVKEVSLGIEERKLPRFDFRKIFSRFTGQAYIESVERALVQSDIPMRAGEFLLLRVGMILGAFLIVQFFTGVFGYAVAAAALAAIIHIPFMSIKRGMRINKFVGQLAEFLILVTNSLRAGQTFLQGVDIASKESPNPIGLEFRQLLKETSLGLPVDQAFTNMLQRVPSEDLQIVMSAFTIQRNIGGNLADIMDQVAATIRQRIQIQGQIRVLTTQGKLSGAIVGLLPIGLGTIVSFMNYDYMALLWRHDPIAGWAGPIMLGIGIFMQLLGCFVIHKICQIEV